MHNLKRDSLLREAEASLERLGVDAIDLYQIHWPDPEADIEEGWSALAELKDRGLVRHIGVSNFDVEQLRRIQQIAPVETLQPPYSLIAREVEDEILPFAEREGIGVIVYSPMGSGLLTGRMTRERIDEPARRRLAQARRAVPGARSSPGTWRRSSGLAAVAERYDTTPGAVAVAWTLRNPAVDGAIVGFRRPDQVDPILAAAGLDLTAEDVEEIERRRTMSTVGFVGLGTMGGRIAGRLLASGHQVHATNRTVAKAQPLIDRGPALAARRRGRSPLPPTSCSAWSATTRRSRRSPADRTASSPG